MNNKEKEIYLYASKLMEDNCKNYESRYVFNNLYTERCIEVPWLVCNLNKYLPDTLLDIGFTFASHDYLRILLDYSKKATVFGMDIVEPQKVKSRYPKDWLEEILNRKIYINDLSKQAVDIQVDAISIISTMEHIGFDQASSSLDSAFERYKNKVNIIREENIEKNVLNNIHKMLTKNGVCFISVPCGKGGPIIIEDSKGLKVCYWEYEEKSWKKIVEHEKFECISQQFFLLEDKWVEVASIDKLNNAESKEFAAGLACCILQKK